MTTKMRSLRNFRNPIGCLILLAAFAAAAGCSTAESPSGSGTNMNHVLPSGSSVSGWLVVPSGGSHASTATLDYIANGGSSGCTQCHGSDLSGGISSVSCFGNPAGCHHDPVANWATPAGHGATAKKAPGSSGFASCQICHAASFTGGGANVSCLNNAACHGAGVASPHAPKPWLGLSVSPYTHTTTDTANAPVCYECHAYTGTANPNNPNVPPTPAPTGTAPGCFNGTMCHNQASHAVPFNTTAHYSVTSVTFPGSCSPCHDVFAPTTKVGPVCQTCHVAASPLEAADCTSCHTSPPDGGAGALYANIAGAHAAHIALNRTGSPVSCDTCHTGLGPSLQNLNHYNRAKSRVSPGDVLFLATYNAQSGSSSFDNSAALSCSNVSCHGGVARSGGNPGTPLNWQTGNLTVNTECTSCHVSGTSQYNSYASGEHPFHVNLFGATATTCSQCHNTTTLALNHFTTLADNSMSPAVASATIGGAGTFITTWVAGAGTSGTCNAQCHPGNRDW